MTIIGEKRDFDPKLKFFKNFKKIQNCHMGKKNSLFFNGNEMGNPKKIKKIFDRPRVWYGF